MEGKERFRSLFSRNKNSMSQKRLYTEDDVKDDNYLSNGIGGSSLYASKNNPENISQYYSKKDGTSLDDKIK